LRASTGWMACDHPNLQNILVEAYFQPILSE
jgi:DNA polymerase I-like protein with 3'-5' exonuclease and polymerase domains